MTVPPPRWTPEQLEVSRRAAVTLFREERMHEDLELYMRAFDEYRGAVEDLLETTLDLANLGSAALDVVTNPNLLLALRYVAGPPISEDDLKTIADASLAPGKLRSDPAMVQRVIETILIGLDRQRFPWVLEDREPDASERDAAALASAALLATQHVSTSRRSDAKTRQEEAVRDALLAVDFEQVPVRTMHTLSDAPGNGQFCREAMFGTRKADFAIGLWDGRKMPLECKVSNSSTNSIKRLNNDAAVKAGIWIGEFGTAQTVPAAMLSGVFKVRNLETAQNSHLTLFWAHALERFTDWIESTRS